MATKAQVDAKMKEIAESSLGGYRWAYLVGEGKNRHYEPGKEWVYRDLLMSQIHCEFRFYGKRAERLADYIIRNMARDRFAQEAYERSLKRKKQKEG